MSQRDYLEKDYYAALGVSKDASQADISKAYRKLARELHPDANPDDPKAETRFKEISEAYSVLSKPEKRAEYDKVRDMMASGAFSGAGPGGAGGFSGFPGGAGGPGAQTFDLGDLLGGFFGEGGRAGGFGGGSTSGRRQGRGATAGRGRDLETDLTLSFEDAMAGVTTTLRVSGPARCTTCGGSGARPGTSPITCRTCGGNGVITQDQGMFGFSEPCPTCGGRGQEVTDPCPTCNGSGSEVRTREVRARIPAGVKDGARIRLPGKGEAGTFGGPPGDLFVRVHVGSHELFGRKGDDLTLRVPITFSEAALGTKLRIPTLDGSVTVKVPPGTESGKTFRVRGRGAPKAKGAHGDLHVKVDIWVPSKLSRTQKKMLEDFAATEPDDLREHLEARLAEPEGV